MTTDMARALMDALHAGSGTKAGAGVQHVRGLLLEGCFRATATAARFCMAAVFGGEEQHVFARFSSTGADPHVDQRSPAAEPRGLGLRIGNKATMVLVGQSLEAFPASDPLDFLGFLHALDPHEPMPDALVRHFAENPAAFRFQCMRQSAFTTSFSALDYHMLHPYRLVAADGHVRIGRLSVRATHPYVAKGPPDGPDYLDRRLRNELSKGSVLFVLLFTAAPVDEDPADISRPWDPELPAIALGHIWLQQVAPARLQRRWPAFDPALLPTGIAFAGDPMLQLHLAAYRLAESRRLGG